MPRRTFKSLRQSEDEVRDQAELCEAAEKLRKTGMYQYLCIGTVPSAKSHVPVSPYWYGTYRVSTGTYQYLRVGMVPGVNRYVPYWLSNLFEIIFRLPV